MDWDVSVLHPCAGLGGFGWQAAVPYSVWTVVNTLEGGSTQ